MRIALPYRFEMLFTVMVFWAIDVSPPVSVTVSVTV